MKGIYEVYKYLYTKIHEMVGSRDQGKNQQRKNDNKHVDFCSMFNMRSPARTSRSVKNQNIEWWARTRPSLRRT